MADHDKPESRSQGSSEDWSKDVYYAHDMLVDPEEKKSLHRDLSARQISMIAVRPFFSAYAAHTYR